MGYPDHSKEVPRAEKRTKSKLAVSMSALFRKVPAQPQVTSEKKKIIVMLISLRIKGGK